MDDHAPARMVGMKKFIQQIHQHVRVAAKGRMGNAVNFKQLLVAAGDNIAFATQLLKVFAVAIL